MIHVLIMNYSDVSESYFSQTSVSWLDMMLREMNFATCITQIYM